MKLTCMYFVATATFSMVAAGHATSSFEDLTNHKVKSSPSIISLGEKAPVAAKSTETLSIDAKTMDDSPANDSTAATNQPSSKRHGPVMVMKEGEISQVSVRPSVGKPAPAVPVGESRDSGMEGDPKSADIPVTGTDDVVTSAAVPDKESVTDTSYKPDELRH